MLQIPIQAVPNQQLTVTLANQPCQINIYQKGYGDTYALYVDLYVNNALIIGGVIAQNANRIVRSLYLGFVGDLAFWDTQDASDPDYAGLGSRFLLFYITPAELNGAG